MCVGLGNSFFLMPDSRSACLPELAITVHVFVFIVFASLHSGREEYGKVSVPRLCRTEQFLGLFVGVIANNPLRRVIQR
jgi:hypothetical protein